MSKWPWIVGGLGAAGTAGYFLIKKVKANKEDEASGPSSDELLESSTFHTLEATQNFTRSQSDIDSSPVKLPLVGLASGWSAPLGHEIGRIRGGIRFHSWWKPWISNLSLQGSLNQLNNAASWLVNKLDGSWPGVVGQWSIVPARAKNSGHYFVRVNRGGGWEQGYGEGFRVDVGDTYFPGTPVMYMEVDGLWNMSSTPLYFCDSRDNHRKRFYIGAYMVNNILPGLPLMDGMKFSPVFIFNIGKPRRYSPAKEAEDTIEAFGGTPQCTGKVKLHPNTIVTELKSRMG